MLIYGKYLQVISSLLSLLGFEPTTSCIPVNDSTAWPLSSVMHTRDKCEKNAVYTNVNGDIVSYIWKTTKSL